MDEDRFRGKGRWTTPSDEKALTEEDFHQLLADTAITKKLIRYVTHWTKNRELAEDFSQEAWLTVAEEIPRGKKIYASGLFGLAAKIAYRCAFKHWKKHEGLSFVPVNAVSFVHESGGEKEWDILADKGMDQYETRLLLQELVNGLDDREAVAVLAKFLGGRRDDEVAADLGITMNYLRVIRNRAKAKMVDMLSRDRSGTNASTNG